MSAPTGFDRYTLVLLVRPGDAPNLPAAEIDRLQEEARALLADDPAARAGRLDPQMLTWLTRRGALRLGESASS